MKALVVFTFAGQQAMLDRHLPTFRNRGADIVVVSPCNAPMIVPTDVIGLQIGRSEYCGEGLTHRIGMALTIISALGYETICCIEGDSIVLGEIPDADPFAVDCIMFESEDPSFKATHFCHWPWIFSSVTASCIGELFLDSIRSKDIERGFPDRLLGWCCQSAFDLRHIGKLAYSRNLIDRPQYLEEAKQAVRDGARFIHGIKTKEVFDALIR